VKKFGKEQMAKSQESDKMMKKGWVGKLEKNGERNRQGEKRVCGSWLEERLKIK